LHPPLILLGASNNNNNSSILAAKATTEGVIVVVTRFVRALLLSDITHEQVLRQNCSKNKNHFFQSYK